MLYDNIYKGINNEKKLDNILYGGVLRTGNAVGDGSVNSEGILINKDGLYACEANQTLDNANVKILQNGSAYFKGQIESSSLFVGDENSNMTFDTTNGLQINDPVISDVMIAGEDIIAGDFVAILSTGKIYKTNYYVDTGRNYGVALNSGSIDDEIRVQKSGPFITSGLTSGSFYYPSTAYSDESITLDETNRDSVYDASLGVGQIFKGSRLFNSAISFYLSSPLGTGIYNYKLSILELFSSEGGLSSDSSVNTGINITSSNGVATITTILSDIFYKDDYIYISGANESEYNGCHKVINIGPSNTNVQFNISGTPASPATGTITSSYRHQVKRKTGSVSITGTGENFFKFDLSYSGRYPGTNEVYSCSNGGYMNSLFLVEFTAENAGELNIAYNSFNTYTYGSLFLNGIIDTNKDLAFRLRERGGAGVISPSVLTTTSTLGLARSTDRLLIGKFN